MASSCLADIFSSSSPGVLGFWFCLLRTQPNNSLFSFLFPLTGGSPHFRFRVRANRLASTFLPTKSGDFVRATRCHPSQVTEYRLVAPIYHHALTVILWWLATVNSNKRIAVIPLPSSQWDITWQILPYQVLPLWARVSRIDCNEEALWIPLSSRARASPSECSMS